MGKQDKTTRQDNMPKRVTKCGGKWEENIRGGQLYTSALQRQPVHYIDNQCTIETTSTNAFQNLLKETEYQYY